VTSGAQVASAQESLFRERRLFFGLLVAVTLVPYLLFPFQARLPADAAGLQWLVATVLFLGAAGHVAAGFYYYSDANVRRFMFDSSPPRYVILPLGLVVVTGIAYFMLDPVGRAYFLIAFWVWQVHHFTRQNHGILSFASVAWNEPVQPRERLAITLTDVAAILATCSFMTPYRETLLADFGWHLHAVALGVYASAWLAWLSASPWRRLRNSAGRELVLLVLMAYYLPLFLFRDAYSAVFIYLTAHGLQYLVFMSWVAKTPARARIQRAILLVFVTLAGGFAIRWLQNDAYWSTYGITALGFAYGVTMWHFLLDAGVWRLSDAFPRRYMGERFGFLRS
jgi:hypothetical protein